MPQRQRVRENRKNKTEKKLFREMERSGFATGKFIYVK